MRDVTSCARQGGAGDTAGTQVGLLKLISAPVLALVGRAQQQGRSGTAKSAFERRNVWREKCSLNPRNGQPLRPHSTRYVTCNGNSMCRFTLPPALVMLFCVPTEPLRVVGVRFWSTSYFVPNASASTGLSEHEYGKTVWTEFTVFPYPIAFSDALSGFSSTSSHGVARSSEFAFSTVRD